MSFSYGRFGLNFDLGWAWALVMGFFRVNLEFGLLFIVSYLDLRFGLDLVQARLGIDILFVFVILHVVIDESQIKIHFHYY